MKKTLIFFVTILALAQTLRATTYYVSKSGSDSNAGTSTNAAFLTISKAASVVNAGDTCYILSGTYRENVTPAHSGTAGSPITFAAYAGATPIVSGADVITNSWSVYSGSIYQATVTGTVNQLFVDGHMMNIARWPNANVDELLYAPRSAPTSVSLTSVTDNNLPSGLSLVGAYVHFFDSESGNQGYAANTRPITGWNSSTKTFSWVTNVYRADSTGCLYYVYGALSLLDIPSEWYQTNTTLYLWAPDSASPSNHVVETKNRTNAFTLDYLSYITVNGIYVFAAGISMANTTNCIVDNCDLIYVQHDMTADYNHDVHIANQVSGKGSQWLNSVVEYSSQDGIRLSGANEVVSNCVIYNVDYYPGTYYACVSPHTGGSDTTVIDNTLWYSGRFCVGVSSTNATICSNDLAYGELLTSDGGAEYVYASGGNGNGTTIHHNWAHNSWAGVYVDGGQYNYYVYCNLCYSNYVGMQFNQFSNNLIINNTTASNTYKDIQFNGSGDSNVKLINNLWDTTANTYGSTVVSNNGWYPPLAANFVPAAGSGAINGGIVYAPYTDGYVGSAPDIGAFVGGANTYWVPGANFVPQPFPRLGSSSSNSTYEDTVLADNPTSYWPLNETTGTTIHDLVGANNGTCVNTNGLTLGGAGVVPGQMAIYFNNTNNGYISVPYSSTLNTTNFSAEVWLNMPTFPANAQSANENPLSFCNGNTPHGWTFDIQVANGSNPDLYAWAAKNSSAWNSANSGVAIQATWSYYAMTFNGTTLTVYTNGVSAASATMTNYTMASAGQYLLMGDYNDGSDSPDTNRYYQGGMQNVAVYASALSAGRILAHYQAGTNAGYAGVIAADHPASYWPMNETSGTIIHDVIGTNNGTAMNINGLTLDWPGVLASEGGASIYFNNTNNGYISVPYSSTLNTTNFSAEVWLNMPTFPANAQSANENPLSFCNGNTPHGWTFDIQVANAANPSMYAWAAKNASGWNSANSGVALQGQWVCYTMTFNGATLTIYTNGVSAASASVTNYTMVNSGQYLYIGDYNDGANSPDTNRYYEGAIERVSVYTNALSPSRILAHYQSGTNSP